MEKLERKTVLNQLGRLRLRREAEQFVIELKQAAEGTEVIFGRSRVGDLLPGLMIRLKRTKEVERLAPGFRELVESLQKLEADSLVDDYAFFLPDAVYRLLLEVDTSRPVGAYIKARSAALPGIDA